MENKTKKRILMLIIILAAACIIFTVLFLLLNIKDKFMPNNETNYEAEIIELPDPKYDSETSVEEALLKRRSVRRYSGEPATLFEVSQLLWAAQGITDQTKGFRTAPSAGALYPLEVYIVAGNVNGIQDGVYKYEIKEHKLRRILAGDKRRELCDAALDQSSVKDAAAVIVLSAVYERTTAKYGEKGVKYANMEAGHAAQNVYLQSASLNLGTVVVGAFDSEEVKNILNMPEEESPLYLMPVGRK